MSLHLPRIREVHGGPRMDVVNVLRGPAPGCFRLRQATIRIRVQEMKNRGCRMQPGVDYRLRELGVVALTLCRVEASTASIRKSFVDKEYGTNDRDRYRTVSESFFLR